MAAEFEAAGARIVPFGEPSDVCVIHTCAVTANAERTCIRLARSVKSARPRTRVVLAGCAVEYDRDRLLRLARADRAAGHADKFRLPGLLGLPPPRDSNLRLVPRFQRTRALVKVQDGCSFGCAYCVVPLTRGPSVSRPLREILEEVRALAGEGFLEIGLTGANLGCYRDGRRGLVALLESVEAVPGIRRIRLSSIEISTVERAVIAFMAQSQKLCRYLHLPLQSGDNRILAGMGRRYTAEQYRDLVQEAVETLSGPGLGTDLIAGLPGEDERAFRNTVSLVHDLPFTNLHVFPYSHRPGTAAARMSHPVPPEVRKRRVRRLLDLAERKRARFARSLLGREVTMLVEQIDGRGRARGWTSEYVPAALPAAGLEPNRIVPFTPTRFQDGVLS